MQSPTPIESQSLVRDIAVLSERYQQYIDYLDELLDSEINIDVSVTVRIDGKQTIKFKNIEDVAEWITNIAK